MKLKSYLKANRIPVPAFAESVGVNRQAIYSYLRDEKKPSEETMLNIVTVTGGAVMPNDFYNIDQEAADAS